MDRKTQWHLMTWQELREAQKRNPVILVPAGTIETQGLQGFVGLETIVPQRLAEGVARQTNAIVAPAIPFGYSSLFQDIPGTITLRPDVLCAVYEDVVRALLKQGFDHILFMAMHVPNHTVVRIVADKIRDELGILIGWMNTAQVTSALLKEMSPHYATTHGHGADPGLSLAAYLEPDMVDLAHPKPNEVNEHYLGFPLDEGKLNIHGIHLNLALRFEETSPKTGGRGDTSYASAAQGEAIFSQAVTRICGLVEQFAALQTRL